MKKQFRLVAVLLFSALLLPVAAFAKGYNIPSSDWVVDQANVISSSDETALKNYLVQLEKNTGIQICVLTLKSLNGASLEDYSLAVAENWGIGKKGSDNGALLLVSMNEHAMRIEVGYGLEGDLTDAKSGLIIRKVLTPYFKEGKYSEGIVAGVEAMAQAAAGEAAGTVSGTKTTSRTYTITDDDDDESDALFNLFIFIIVIIVLFSRAASSSRHARRYGGYGRRDNGSFWRTLFWLSMLNDSNHHHGGRGGRGGGFGGGGGFSGFSGGGGHFGGGGASGHW